MSKILSSVLVCFSLAACSRSAVYPVKDLTFIVQSAPGGPSDFVGQTLSLLAEKNLGRKINVIYKPGGSGSIGMSALATAKPDGYTIGLLAGDLVLLKGLGVADLTPDDFTPIIFVLNVPATLSVHVDSPYKTIGDLVAHGKISGKVFTSGNSGPGTVWALSGKVFAKTAGVSVTQVPFDGSGPARTALLGKHIDMAVTGLGDVLNESKAGKLRILGVMAEKRLSVAPEVPTFREQGFNLVYASWLGIAAPRGLPADLRDQIYAAYKKAFDDPSAANAYLQRGYVHEDMDGAAFGKFMAGQMALFAPLVGKTAQP